MTTVSECTYIPIYVVKSIDDIPRCLRFSTVESFIDYCEQIASTSTNRATAISNMSDLLNALNWMHYNLYHTKDKYNTYRICDVYMACTPGGLLKCSHVDETVCNRLDVVFDTLETLIKNKDPYTHLSDE